MSKERKNKKLLKNLKEKGNGFFSDFKKFISKGNVLQLAIAFIMGLAFNAIVNSLVNDVIMQFIAAIFGKADFSELVFYINGTAIYYGKFLMTVINFLLIAFSLFMIVKIVTKVQKGIESLQNKIGVEKKAAEPALEKTEDILKDIRKLLKDKDKEKAQE